MKVISLIEAHWQKPRFILNLLLWLPAKLFALIVALRRLLYRFRVLKSYEVARPVVVVGNLHAGGVGKTPIVAALAQSLQQLGVNVGIVSRGTGRTLREVVLVNENSTADEVGDEPLMLHQKTGVPVAVAGSRVAAAQFLLGYHPEVALIIADDGLQHYALKRALEVVVFPQQDVGKKLDMLPNGPLREGFGRLQRADALVVNAGSGVGLPADGFDGAADWLPRHLAVFRAQLEPQQLYRWSRPHESLNALETTCKKVAALAAIARPHRFFNTLKILGFNVTETVVLPDHSAINLEDLPQADMVLVSEKDAVKMSRTWDNIWVLPVESRLEPDLAAWVMDALTQKGAPVRGI